MRIYLLLYLPSSHNSRYFTMIMRMTYAKHNNICFVAELWKEELVKKRDVLLLNDKMSVRLELFSEAAREGAVSALRSGANMCAGADAVGDAMRGLTGNFRKLEVD